MNQDWSCFPSLPTVSVCFTLSAHSQLRNTRGSWSPRIVPHPLGIFPLENGNVIFTSINTRMSKVSLPTSHPPLFSDPPLVVLNCLCWDGPKALSFIEDRYKETAKAQGKRPETLIAKSTPLDYENERPRAPRNKLRLDSTFGCSPFEQPLSGAATYRCLSCFVCIRFGSLKEWSLAVRKSHGCNAS